MVGEGLATELVVLLTCFVLVLPLLGVFLIRIGVVPLRVSCDLMEVSHSAHKAAFDDADSPNSWIARPSGSCHLRRLSGHNRWRTMLDLPRLAADDFRSLQTAPEEPMGLWLAPLW